MSYVCVTQFFPQGILLVEGYLFAVFTPESQIRTSQKAWIHTNQNDNSENAISKLIYHNTLTTEGGCV